MTHNAADRKSIRAAEKATRARELREAEVVRGLCSTKSGREYVWNLLSSCQIFAAIYPSHPELGAVLGERNVGLRILAQVMSHCPDLYLLAQQEANERSNAERAAAEQSRSPDAGGDDSGPEPSSYDTEWNPTDDRPGGRPN